MPDYTRPVSDDTPCLELPLDEQELAWLKLHLGHAVRLVMLETDVCLECTTCDAYLLATEALE